MPEQDYPYVRAWGRYMGSQEYYINGQVQRARETSAPDDAIFERHAPDGSGKTGEWATWSGISDPLAKAQVAAVVEGWQR